jgi:hypothetical protein
MLNIEGEEGARVRGHWWIHAGTGGVIRGVKCASEGGHVMTIYGGCWLLENCELRCCAGSGGPHGVYIHVYCDGMRLEAVRSTHMQNEKARARIHMIHMDDS